MARSDRTFAGRQRKESELWCYLNKSPILFNDFFYIANKPYPSRNFAQGRLPHGNEDHVLDHGHGA
jgi:hypothetical protein